MKCFPPFAMLSVTATANLPFLHAEWKKANHSHLSFKQQTCVFATLKSAASFSLCQLRSYLIFSVYEFNISGLDLYP